MAKPQAALYSQHLLISEEYIVPLLLVVAQTVWEMKKTKFWSKVAGIRLVENYFTGIFIPKSCDSYVSFSHRIYNYKR
ncbi:hypothetical protein IR124_08920 [Streptococcus acidominimus]|nr:hypothetical protein [Streptococcus acidominimus]